MTTKHPGKWIAGFAAVCIIVGMASIASLLIFGTASTRLRWHP